MKKSIIILSCAIAAFCSCTKTKTNTVDIVKNDTIVLKPNIIGNWKSNTDSISFTAYEYTLDSYPSIPYIVIAQDTIADISPSNIVYPTWSYLLSSNNDTLYLTDIIDNKSSNIYIRK